MKNKSITPDHFTEDQLDMFVNVFPDWFTDKQRTEWKHRNEPDPRTAKFLETINSPEFTSQLQDAINKSIANI